jgi:carnitine O-acetyltransferase
VTVGAITIRDTRMYTHHCPHTRSWLSEWWNRYMYLRDRPPNVINVSYYFHFADNSLAWSRTQPGRAAILLSAMLSFRNGIVRFVCDVIVEMVIGIFKYPIISGQMSPIMAGKSPMCSTPFKYLFNSCRIPQVEEDRYRIYDPAAHNHVAVVCNNKFFTFEARLGGEDLSTGDLMRCALCWKRPGWVYTLSWIRLQTVPVDIGSCW